MSASRLGRGRGGRLAVYVGCGVVVLLLIFLYRAATSEMARLQELQIQCAYQQEALAAQLQVIFEYKVRLEKSLAEEKSSNVAVKQELQQRASREKSLRDKDSVEAMQRFNSLQQTYKILQSEHQDLQEECKKREKQAFEDSNRLEETLQELRSRLKQAQEAKEKSLEHLKNKYLELETEKGRLEDKYKELIKSNGNTDSIINHLKKEVFQLTQELKDSKKSCDRAAPSMSSLTTPRSAQEAKEQTVVKSHSQSGLNQDDQASQQQIHQVSRPSNDGELPQPLPAPRNHHMVGDVLSSEKAIENAQPTEQQSDVGFAQLDGNIVPVGPNDLKDVKEQPNDALPIPYDFRNRQEQNVDDNGGEDAANNAAERKEEKANDADDEEQPKLVLPPPDRNSDRQVYGKRRSSSWSPIVNGSLAKVQDDVSKQGEKSENLGEDAHDELQALQEQSPAALSSAKTALPAKSGNTTKSNPNMRSFEKASILAKPVSKMKLPLGVVPIPVMMDQRVENEEEKPLENSKKKDEAGQNAGARSNLDVDSAEKEQLEVGNANVPFPALPPVGRHVGEEVLDRREQDDWFKVKPGVQEFGDELNHIGRLPGLDQGADRPGDIDDHYEDIDYKDIQQKNNDIHLVEDEDEDDQMDYPHNLKQEKHE